MEPLSWTCPLCGREGDLRCTLQNNRCPYCGTQVQATSYVRRDKSGRISISQDWGNASGYPDEGFVFVVRGRTGEYDGRTYWSVIAYTSWERAKIHAISAELRAWELCKKYEDVPKRANEFDPKMVDYTGVSYYVDAVLLED